MGKETNYKKGTSPKDKILTGTEDIYKDRTLQDDINNGNSKPFTTRQKWSGDSANVKAKADKNGEGKSFKGQAKIGGATASRTRNSPENGMKSMIRDH